MPGQVLTLRAEHQRDEISTPSAAITDRRRDDPAAVELWRTALQRGQRSLRQLRHLRQQTTFRIAPALLIPETESKLKGSVGTGFKAPTLAELFQNFPSFNFFGNPNLKPETSIGYLSP